MKALLALEDGRTFEGKAFGFAGETSGEVVFNTSLTGYQEILTDPSYRYQIVTMTYPHIGNTGVNLDDVESERPQVSGFVVRENSPIVSNFRSTSSLDAYLKKHKILAIEGVDTRALTKHLRDFGSKRGVISTTDLDPKSLVEKANAAKQMAGLDLVKDVTSKGSHKFTEELLEGYEWNVFSQSSSKTFKSFTKKPYSKIYHCVAIDCGMKHNIGRKLVQNGFRVTVASAFLSAEEILKLKPDGVFLSNGPGDPEPVSYVITTVRELLGKVPIFGICLGHQILGLACGGKTYKLKFGHRGGNQPVMDLRSRKVEITSQNHGFAVNIESLDPKEVELTHINLNDKTSEGMRHKKVPAFSVQYHPESSPGPHDSDYLFKEFYNMVKEERC